MQHGVASALAAPSSCMWWLSLSAHMHITVISVSRERQNAFPLLPLFSGSKATGSIAANACLDCSAGTSPNVIPLSFDGIHSMDMPNVRLARGVACNAARRHRTIHRYIPSLPSGAVGGHFLTRDVRGISTTWQRCADWPAEKDTLRSRAIWAGICDTRERPNQCYCNHRSCKLRPDLCGTS